MKNKKILIGGIFLVLLVSLVGTYAYYTATSSNSMINATAASANLELTITKSAGGTTLVPQLSQYLQSALTGTDSESCIDGNGNTVCQVYEITIENKGTSTISLTGTLSLVATNMTNLKWELLATATTVKTSRNTKSKTDTKLVNSLVLNADASKTYYVAVWIEETSASQSDSGSFNGTISFTSIGGAGVTSSFSPMNATEKIMTLAAASSSEILTIEQPATNQTTAQTEYRYWGATPSNYVWFNCDAVDGSNNAYGSDNYSYSSTTCEKWRIIGVFETEDSIGTKDYRVKIIRNDSIGYYSWDNKNDDTGAASGYGSNNWSNARLMKLLNSDYISETYGGSLYYTRTDGDCYSGSNNATKTCNLSNKGLKTSSIYVTATYDIKNYIAKVKWYLGGQNSNNYIEYWWNRQRSNNKYKNNPTSWLGEIGLIYGDDYGYAAGLACASTTSTKKITYNSDSSKDYRACKSTNWLYNGDYQWLLSPSSSDSYYVAIVNSSGNVYYDYYYAAYGAVGVRPTLYLEPSIKIVGGMGTSVNPYIIST